MATADRQWKAAALLAAVVVASVGLVPAAVTAESSTQEVVTAERTIATTQLEPGETTEVTVRIETGSSADVTFVDQFNPAVGTASITGADPLPTVSTARDDNSAVTAIWSDRSAMTVTYQVAVPEDAEPGTIYTIFGQVSVANGGNATVSGQNTIRVVESGGTTESSPTPTDGDDETPTDGDDETPTDGDDGTPTDGDDETPMDGDDGTPADGGDETPMDGNDETPTDGDDGTPTSADGDSDGSGGATTTTSTSGPGLGVVAALLGFGTLTAGFALWRRTGQ